MGIYGSTPTDFVAISATESSLVCGIGEDSEEQKVLVPYVQVRFKKVDDLDAEPAEATFSNAFSGTLAYENVAFLVMDLARDLRGITRQLKEMSGGPVGAEKSRLEYSVLSLRSAQASIEVTLKLLDELAVVSKMLPTKPRVRVSRPRVGTTK